MQNDECRLQNEKHQTNERNIELNRQRCSRLEATLMNNGKQQSWLGEESDRQEALPLSLITKGLLSNYYLEEGRRSQEQPCGPLARRSGSRDSFERKFAVPEEVADTRPRRPEMFCEANQDSRASSEEFPWSNDQPESERSRIVEKPWLGGVANRAATCRVPARRRATRDLPGLSHLGFCSTTESATSPEPRPFTASIETIILNDSLKGNVWRFFGMHVDKPSESVGFRPRRLRSRDLPLGVVARCCANRKSEVRSRDCLATAAAECSACRLQRSVFATLRDVDFRCVV